MSGLETVSMRKGREYKPRLSVPYDPNKPRDKRYWTEAEIEIVREYFPKGGAAACLAKLPGRTTMGVYNRAHDMKLRAPGRKGGRRKLYVMTRALERRMREAWPSLTKRGDITRFAEEALKLPKWWVLKQAVKLGLSISQRKEPPWTPAENELMTKVPLHAPDKASQIFREHGFSRTPTAIVVRAKRLGIARRYKETLSGTSLAKILGVDNKTTTSWCIEGLIKATRRESKRLPQQGGAPWSITRADARKFVIDNLARLDIRKVDKVAFVDLLVNAGPDGGAS